MVETALDLESEGYSEGLAPPQLGMCVTREQVSFPLWPPSSDERFPRSQSRLQLCGFFSQEGSSLQGSWHPSLPLPWTSPKGSINPFLVGFSA